MQISRLESGLCARQEINIRTKETAVVTYGKAKCGDGHEENFRSLLSATNVALTATPSLVYARLCSNRRTCNFLFISQTNINNASLPQADGITSRERAIKLIYKLQHAFVE